MRPGRYHILRIEDTGDGMDRETRDRIFEPFFTTKFTGRGLGLSAALGILTKHGAGILVESVPGKGTVVTLLFRPAPSVKPSAPAASGGGFPGEGTKRVLVVDDEEAVRTILDMILKRAGYETVLAGNGLEGLRRIEAGESFGAVVLDMTMPVMDGVEAFARIRNIHPEMPVLLISGFARSPEASRLSNEPGTLFLAKPFNRDGFLNGLRALLDGKCRVPTNG